MREGYTKKQLVKLLELTIKATRAGADVKALTLDGGVKQVNIKGDSGIAIIMDVDRSV